MSPQQALEFLNQVTAQVTANRQVHAQIAQAISTLQIAIQSAPQVREVKKGEEK